jgi:putative ABC transport system permease protein
MTFATLILKNLLRERARTALTVLGISIGITTVVALGIIVGGLKQTAGEMLHAYGSDFIVARKGASDLTLSAITEEEADRVAARPDVERTLRALLEISQVGGNPYFVTMGVRAQDLAQAQLTLVDGQLLMPDGATDAVLGDGAAASLHRNVGDTVTIGQRDYHVVGVFHTGNTWQDNGAIVPLKTLQEAVGKVGSVTAMYVTAKDGADPKAIADDIRATSPLLTTVASTSEYSRVDQGMELMDALNLAISVLAVGLGAIGVMNTMVMSVFERTREIGILRAVGWRGSRIMRMIVGESLVLCVFAAVVGSALGIAAARAVMMIPAVKALLEPQYTIGIFARGLIVAVLVALAGAAYPALRAVRLAPMEALRHE